MSKIEMKDREKEPEPRGLTEGGLTGATGGWSPGSPILVPPGDSGGI